MSVRVVPFDPRYAAVFASLNRAWIERFFVLEAPDLAVLEDPYRAIVEPGGQVFFALMDGQVVGTAAALRHSPDAIELAKMAVDQWFQGHGIGRLVGDAVIDFARSTGARSVFLLTNSGLAPALRLYERLGFERRPLPPATGYVRADVYMELVLAPPVRGA